MGCGILFPRDYRREWDDADDAAMVGRGDAVNGAADVDAELGAGDAGFSSSESEDEQWWERPNPDNGTKVQVTANRRSTGSVLCWGRGRHMPRLLPDSLVVSPGFKS